MSRVLVAVIAFIAGWLAHALLNLALWLVALSGLVVVLALILHARRCLKCSHRMTTFEEIIANGTPVRLTMAAAELYASLRAMPKKRRAVLALIREISPRSAAII